MIVLTVGRMLPKATGEFDPAHKERLDWLHKRKIDLCDWVWVLDVGGYVGESTRSEIAYAEAIGRPVRYLSREFPDYVEPPDEISDLRAQLADAAARIAAKDAALREIERHCPCGARPESLKTHPHVGGCPVYEGLHLAGGNA